MTYEEYCAKCKDYGLSNYSVSKLTGVSRATISQWKNGNTKPSESTIKRLEYLFDNYNPMQEYPEGFFGKQYTSEQAKKRAELIAKYFPYQEGPLKDNISPAPLPMPNESEIQAIPKVFNIDSVSVYLNRPIQLSERQYQELVRGTEAFIDSWIKLHKNDKGV